MSTRSHRSRFRVSIYVIAIVILLYSILIVGRPLIGIWLITAVFLLSLVWRAVRALERIASATERLGTQLDDGGER